MLRVFYDCDCHICSASARRWSPVWARHGFVATPLQSHEARERLGLAVGELPDEMKVETRSGGILGGIDGMLYVYRHIWWAWPAWLIGHLPGIHAFLVWRYRRFAAQRICGDGACGSKAKR